MQYLQSLLVGISVVGAVAYLVNKWRPRPHAKKGGSCDTNCGCH
ncbi:MAG: FeoB-associated Cys-rich membrane protein [Flavobacteriaceae bacterium]